MPSVPYSPIPDVAAQDIPSPFLRVQVDPNAFGAGIARAVQGLGGTLEKSGDELFSRAVAMQELRNQAEHDDLTTQFLNRTAPIHANFSSLEGRNAYDGLKQYGDDLEDVRKDVESQASNPRVQQLFRSASRNQVARDLFNGAGHAGQQLKLYQNTSINGRVEATTHAAGLNPADDEGFQQRVDEVTSLERQKAELSGQDPEDATAKAVSRMWKERLVTLGRTDSSRAAKLLKDNADKIRTDDYAAADKAITYQTNTTGARMISSDIFSGRNTRLGQGVVGIEDAKKAIGGFESGDRYDIKGPPTRLGRALGRYQVMEAELPSQLKEAGLPSMTPEEFLKNPDAQDKLFSAVFGNLMTKYGSFNEAASRWFTGRSVADARSAGVKDVFGTNVDKYLANTNAILARISPTSKVVAAGVAEAQERHPDDPLISDYTTQHVIQDHNRMKALDKDEKIQTQDTIAGAIQGEFSGGQTPKNIDELRSIPQVQQLIETGKLSQKELLDLPAKLNRYRSAIAVKTNQEAENTLRGMAEEEPLQFEAIPDFTTYELSQKQIGEMQKLQRQKRASAEGDPELAKAYRAIRPQLPDDFDSAGNKDLRQQFKGALQGAVIDRMQEKGRKLTQEEYTEVGKQLLRQTLVPGWFTWITGNKVPSDPWYQQNVDVPPKAEEAIIQDWDDQGLGVPNKTQIRNDYVRGRFNKDFGKKKE